MTDGAAGRGAAGLTPDDIAVLRARRSRAGEIVDLVVVRTTAALARLVGTTPEHAVGRGLLEMMPDYDRDRFRAFAHVVETQLDTAMEFDTDQGGVHRTVKLTLTPFEDGVIIVVRDVSVERTVTASLRQDNELFTAITQAMSDAVAMWSAVRADGRIVDLRYEYVNEAAERLIGVDRADLLGRGLLELFPARGEQGVFRRYCEVIESGVPTTVEIRWGDSTAPRVVEASVVRFGDGVVSAGREITSHKLSEARLVASERRYRLLTDFASDGAVQTRRGVVEWVSPSTTANFGWEASDLIGHDVFEFLHPADLEPAVQTRTGAAMGRVGDRSRARLRRKDGSWNWIDYRYRPLPDAAPTDAIGVTTIWNVQAEVDALAALAEAERERAELEERLVQSRKLEALGQLTGGVAHDFNNLLTVIIGGTELLRDAHAGDVQTSGITSLVLGAAHRGADLTRRLLAFARRQTLQPTVVDPVTVVSSMSELLRSAIGKDVEVVITSETDGWLVSIDRSQFEASLMNLCVNARGAMPDGGVLSISAQRATVLPPQPDEPIEIEPGDYVVVSVTDSGAGMTDEVAEHAFDPFFTTKESSRGNGLGLSTVYGFIKQSGGHVGITSELGRGTEVTMHLPRTTAPAAMPDQSHTSDAPTGAGEVVLVVEDDPAVRSLAVRLVSELGYSTVEAADGHAAAAVIDGPMHIDLLFTDVVMTGGMTGPQLAAHSARRRPDLRVLYTSGYTEDVDLRRDGPVAELLPKPYLRNDLAAALRRAIDAPAPGVDGAGH